MKLYLWLLPLLAGCLDAIDPLDPAVGGALADRCSDQDSDPDTEVSFRGDLQPILRKDQGRAVGCNCHQPNQPDPIGFEQAGLDLSSYAGLLAGGNNSQGTAIVPGAPCESILYQKISAGPPFGSRMPFNGPPFLDAATRQLFADWIAEGARDN